MANKQLGTFRATKKVRVGTSKEVGGHESASHGCCWETFDSFACCGLVVEIQPLNYKSLNNLLLPFQRQAQVDMNRDPPNCDVLNFSLVWKVPLANGLRKGCSFSSRFTGVLQ